jgi:spore maturation protein CgeB
MKDDINMRCFETMATGTMLLTDRISHIEELFEDKKHLVLYDGLDDMIEKAKYYLDHDEEREKIAQAGYEEVMAKHTIQHRIDVILSEFMKSRQSKEAVHAGV